MDDQQKFDVFLAHNSQDKPFVRAIAKELKKRNLKPWLDEEQIPPGRPFQDEIQQAIPVVKSAAIFIGSQGLGSWQAWELRALISQCVKNNIPVIPVLLPGVNNLPEHLVFLQEFRWINFFAGIDDENALYLLEWGITGQKPGKVPTVEFLQTISSPTSGVSEESSSRQNSTSCVDILRQMNPPDLRRLMVRRLNLSEVRNIWFDTLGNQMDNFMNGRSLEDCIIELLQRAEQRGLTRKLLENLCTERADVANP